MALHFRRAELQIVFLIGGNVPFSSYHFYQFSRNIIWANPKGHTMPTERVRSVSVGARKSIVIFYGGKSFEASYFLSFSEYTPLSKKVIHPPLVLSKKFLRAVRTNLNFRNGHHYLHYLLDNPSLFQRLLLFARTCTAVPEADFHRQTSNLTRIPNLSNH